MADTSPQKEEATEENSFVESDHSNHSKATNESPLKEETIIDKIEEHIPEPVDANRTPSPSISNHSQGESTNDKHDESLIPSSSKDATTNDHDEESPDDPDPPKNESPSIPHDVNPDKPQKPDISDPASNDDDVIHHERDPNDIEPKIEKVIIQGYTEEASEKPQQQQTVESKQSPSAKVPQKTPVPSAATKAIPKTAATADPKKSFHFQKPTQAKPAARDIKQSTVSNGVAAKKPTAPIRSVATTDKKTTVPIKPTTASINAAAKRLSTPLRPVTTERKPFTPAPSVTKRTPSNNPRGTAKAPSTAPARAMSATRSTPAKTENSAHTTPIRNKKYENIQGKVNASSNYTPGGGNVKIFHEKPKFNVTSKIGSLQNANHTPGGGQVKIESRKINFKENAKPKVDAKAEILSPHVEKKILTQKLEWKASSKVGSLANANHKPAGGDVKIFNQKVKVDAAQSKVGSLENANHKPAGGNVNIKEYKVPGNSSSNSVTSHSTGNSRRSSATRNRMPGCHDPISPDEALGRN